MQLNLTMTHTEAMKYILVGLQTRRAEIDQTLQGLRTQLVPAPKSAQSEINQAQPTRKRHFSAATRKAMADAQRRRWAKQRDPEAQPAATKKRKMTAAGRRAIAQAQRARWAKTREKTMAAGG